MRRWWRSARKLTRCWPPKGFPPWAVTISTRCWPKWRCAEEDREELSQSEQFRLLEECRIKKEALHPNTRKIVLDLDHVREGWGTVTVQAADYYERCRPLIEETLHVVEDLLVNSAGDLEALYVTGGGSELPIGEPNAEGAVRQTRPAIRACAFRHRDRLGDPGRRSRPVTC